MNYINHYKLGFKESTHKGKSIVTASIDSTLSEYLNRLQNSEYTVGYIPAGYEHRPDLISNLFYNTVTLDWLIVMFNNIKDPFQELNVGDRILIPKL
jgi:hypothetical protein